MILFSHTSANAAARHPALALARAGVLGEVWTCSGDNCRAQQFPFAAARDHGPSLEIPGSSTRKHSNLDYAECCSLDRIVSTRVTRAGISGVYAFEHGAEATFRSAGKRGLLRIYEFGRGHWSTNRQLSGEEGELEPAWAATIAQHETSIENFERTDAELAQAELIIVPTTFILRTLEARATSSATIALLLPGSPAPDTTPRRRASFRRKKLRAVFVGPLTQCRGLSYLFRACRELRSILDLTIVSERPAVTCAALTRELAGVQWHSITTTAQLRAELAEHDVLLSPAIIDAFDPVLLEAMAAGLPIVATPHTAAADLIDDGVEGFLIPIRSAETMAARLELLHGSPERRAFMSASARCRVRRYTWDNYERTLAAGVATALSHH